MIVSRRAPFPHAPLCKPTFPIPADCLNPLPPSTIPGLYVVHPPRRCCASVPLCPPAHRRWFAGNQIRNVSALGGNIVTGSPISDLNPLWMAARATFVALGKDTGERSVPASEFFTGYR
jgi:hypothetical protein